MYFKYLKRAVTMLGITALLSANIAFADIQQLVPQSAAPSVVTPVTKASPIGCFDFTSNLKQGSKGIAVRYLQYALMKEGFMIPSSEFGMVGSATVSAISSFQEK